MSQPGCEGGREHRCVPGGNQRQNLQQISPRRVLSTPTGCPGQHSTSASSQENAPGITGLKGSIFLGHSDAPKRFVLGCRQRAGALSGGLLTPQGAEPGVTTPSLAWKVSKSLISLFCSARAQSAPFPMTFVVAHHCRQAVTCRGFSFPRLLPHLLSPGFSPPLICPRSLPAKISSLSSVGEKGRPAALVCS